jgi:hypothetical protein
MFTKVQLEFLKGSLTQASAVVPCADGGNVARTFIATLDEIDAQLKERESADAVAEALSKASGNGERKYPEHEPS